MKKGIIFLEIMLSVIITIILIVATTMFSKVASSEVPMITIITLGILLIAAYILYVFMLIILIKRLTKKL